MKHDHSRDGYGVAAMVFFILSSITGGLGHNFFSVLYLLLFTGFMAAHINCYSRRDGD